MYVKFFTIDRDYYSHNREIYDWCDQRFQNGQWNRTDLFGYVTYKFKNTEDYTLFALTWGQYALSMS